MTTTMSKSYRKLTAGWWTHIPTVPNPYTLLSSLPSDWKWYKKDNFFSLSLALKSQKYFAFEWHDPEKGINGQLT